MKNYGNYALQLSTLVYLNRTRVQALLDECSHSLFIVGVVGEFCSLSCTCYKNGIRVTLNVVCCTIVLLFCSVLCFVHACVFHVCFMLFMFYRF